MTAAWVVYVLAVGTLLAIAAEVSAAASRHFGRSTRFAFAGALAGILALAVLAPRPTAVARPLTVSVVDVTAPIGHAARQLTLVDRLRAVRATIGSEAIALSDVMQRRVPPALTRVVLAAWLGVSAALLVLFLLVNRRFALVRRGWPSRSLHGTPVRVSPALGPAVLGFLRAEIVVPQALLARPDDEQRLILAHEREHVRTHDHLLLGGAWLGAILFPWHPAVWYLTNRVRLAIELDCDARVLRGGASPRSYGALLIDMAARQSAVRIGALALVDGPSHLERRIRAMQWTRGRLAAARGLVLGGMGGMLVLAACEARVPTAADVAAMDVNALEKSAQLDLVDGKIAKADYFVNGDAVSADSARAIVATKIGSVEVVKSELPSGRDTIFVTTSDRMPHVRTDGNVLPPSFGGLSSDATLMIDGVIQTPGTRVRQDPKEIASIQVMKPGKDSKYPNGLIAIQTKRYEREAAPATERKPTVTRTDSVVLSSPRGLTSASRLWSDSAVGGPHRVVLMPRDSSAASYKFGVADLERANSAPTLDTARARLRRVTTDPTKPYAIEIDGRRATKAELDQLRSTSANLTYTMYPHDARDMSSDPAAANGLMRVSTKQAPKR